MPNGQRAGSLLSYKNRFVMVLGASLLTDVGVVGFGLRLAGLHFEAHHLLAGVWGGHLKPSSTPGYWRIQEWPHDYEQPDGLRTDKDIRFTA